jgi:hypothetical protein
LVVPPALAVRVAVCAVLTAEIVAEKLALVAPSATVTDVGTVTAVELLERLTAWPPAGAAASSVTVQLSVAAPISEALLQFRLLGTACSVPVLVPDWLPVLFTARVDMHADRFSCTRPHRSARITVLPDKFEWELERQI